MTTGDGVIERELDGHHRSVRVLAADDLWMSFRRCLVGTVTSMSAQAHIDVTHNGAIFSHDALEVSVVVAIDEPVQSAPRARGAMEIGAGPSFVIRPAARRMLGFGGHRAAYGDSPAQFDRDMSGKAAATRARGSRRRIGVGPLVEPDPAHRARDRRHVDQRYRSPVARCAQVSRGSGGIGTQIRARQSRRPASAIPSSSPR